MIEEILPGLYRIEVPLPQNPLRAINSYVIKAQGRSLIIDTGMNREECRSVLSSGLKKLDVDSKKADFFITHLHADHSGLVAKLATDASTVYSNQQEAAILSAGSSEKGKRWQRVDAVYLSHGFPEDEIKRSAQIHPGRRYSMERHVDFYILKEGDTIRIGDYSFRCIETPGHSPGHMCLYEANKRIIISGDHILSDITPNITFWLEMENTLEEYLKSLDKVYDLDVELVLPGHRRTFKNFKERIRELKNHHQARANEILSILQEANQNAYQVASQMSWDIDCESWEQFPGTQRWFATGEALAHLEYLEEMGKVRREMQNQRVVFSLPV